MKTARKDDFASRLKQHLNEVLSISIASRPWPGEDKLPAFLRDAYAFLTAKVMGIPCLFMIEKSNRSGTPAAISKHIFEVGRRWEGEVIYVAVGIDSARRRHLIEQKVPFVVPGNQIYLPMLGIDLREHFRNARRVLESFSPATQAVLLYTLHQERWVSPSPKEIAVSLGYTSMTLSRAFDELEAAGIGLHSVKGRRRVMELDGSRPDLWEKARPFLRSPVIRRVFVKRIERDVGMTAGASALAVYTRLSEPANLVFAVASSAWVSHREKLRLIVTDEVEPNAVEVELWSYRPEAITDGDVVDRLSLYLSITDLSDERVEAARAELLEGMTW